MPYNALLQEKFQLLDIRAKAKESLKRAPEGFARVSFSHGRRQYYLVVPGQKDRYLKPSSDAALIKALAQKQYDELTLKHIEPEIKRIEKYLRTTYENASADGLAPEEEALAFSAKIAYLKLHPELRELVVPYALTTSDYAKRWESASHPRSWINEEGCVFTTEKGDMVRSKSEVIIADKLHRASVPYRYEQPLDLGSKTFHPDFTVLNKSTHQEIIWEHFGMMDDPLYLERALNKINAYAERGYLLGESLIATFESSATPLNTKTLDAIINRLR